jgi:hypothetical protein
MDDLPLNQPSQMPEGGWFARFLPRSQSKAVFLFVMTCYSWTLSTLTARLIRLLGFWPTTDPLAHVRQLIRAGGIDARTIALARLLVGPLLLAPVFESFVVIGVIELLRRLKFSIAVQITGSVSLSCFLHGLEHPVQWLLVAPLFLIGAAAYIYWRQISFWIGAQMIILLHFIHNSIVFLNDLAEYLNR